VCQKPGTIESDLLSILSVKVCDCLQNSEQRQLEGMVAKKLNSTYEGGRTREWLKIKTSAGKEEMRKRIEK